MKVKRYEGTDARRVLAAMATDRTVCGRIAAKWPPEGLFAGRAENLVAGWCVRHVRRYGEPVGRNIETVFQDWSGRADGDEDATRAVERLLLHLSAEHERNGDGRSSEYVLDLAGVLFDKVRMRRVLRAVDADLDANAVAEARDRMTGFARVELGVGAVFRPGEDLEQWRDALDPERTAALITYPGALGKFLDKALARDAFIGITGAMGSGKSWWLLDIGYTAARQRRRVAFFEVGDMSRRQVQRRMGQRALRRPRRDRTCLVPVDFADKDDPVRESLPLKGITPGECMAAWRRLQRGKDLFRLSCHPNTSIDILGIDAVLREWADGGWVADAVIIDYADILAPPPGQHDLRDQINETWRRMRRMSQELHCLVVTATQADAKSYDKRLISRSNFSDDRRKNDHVTDMLGLNVTDAEKELGVLRLNWIKRRDEEFSERRQLWVANCLAVGRPAVLSSF